MSSALFLDIGTEDAIPPTSYQSSQSATAAMHMASKFPRMPFMPIQQPRTHPGWCPSNLYHKRKCHNQSLTYFWDSPYSCVYDYLDSGYYTTSYFVQCASRSPYTFYRMSSVSVEAIRTSFPSTPIDSIC
jgi:hypothetical protein